MRVLITSASYPLPVRCLAALLSLLMIGSPLAAQTADDTGKQTSKAATAKTGHAKKRASRSVATDKRAAKGKKPVSKAGRDRARAAARARTAKIKQAFISSKELRPMAQQLANLRTPAAYAGVTKYAKSHTGEAAAAAYLALGHANLLDSHYKDAIADFQLARQNGEALSDYADFLSAQAQHAQGNQSAAAALLNGFTSRYPDSIFNAQAPELEANILVSIGDAAGAQKVLAEAADSPSADRPGFQLATGQVALSLGQTTQAEAIFKKLLLSHPLSAEAEIARSKLTALGAETTLTTEELRSLGDAFYNGGHYAAASEQYRALARAPGLDATSRNTFAVAAAACDLKLKRLTKGEVESLPDTADENGARRLYLLMELARNDNELDEQKRIVTRMAAEHPQSPWLAEALYSSGAMYLLRRDYATAIQYYSFLSAHFPTHKYAATAHWRSGWFSYRLGLYADAARIFQEQIHDYPSSKEAASALYWQGKLYETQDHNPAKAAANYRTLLRAYPHYFYAQMARQRLEALGDAPPSVADPLLDRIQPPPTPELTEDFPADSPHMAKARLLANAGLNDYIAQEIAADPDSASWSKLAEAQIYASYGETFRALRALKRALPSAASASIKSIPLAYWRILFPEPWWDTIQEESAKNNLDPYLVASLIRQESEFNPSAISTANAYGLMQLLPSVGKSMAHAEGTGHFQTFHLLDPETNIRLGTHNLRQTLNKFGGVTEYALAAYNAGDSRVSEWQAAGPYQGIDEFVESIPFTETREYVEAILRNEEMYREIDLYARSLGKKAAR